VQNGLTALFCKSFKNRAYSRANYKTDVCDNALSYL
jgi:hypothetical protein